MRTVTKESIGEGIVRVVYDARNLYDGHHDQIIHYTKGEKIYAIFNRAGYSENKWGGWGKVSSLRPPHAGNFSDGSNVAFLNTLEDTDNFVIEEINKGLKPYTL